MSDKNISMTLRLVVKGNERVLDQVEAEMRRVCPDLSFSPWIEREELEDCVEVRGSALVSQEERERLLALWNNDWDTDEEDDCYWAYGFNTKMFDSRVYYLLVQF